MTASRSHESATEALLRALANNLSLSAPALSSRLKEQRVAHLLESPHADEV